MASLLFIFSEVVWRPVDDVKSGFLESFLCKSFSNKLFSKITMKSLTDYEAFLWLQLSNHQENYGGDWKRSFKVFSEKFNSLQRLLGIQRKHFVKISESLKKIFCFCKKFQENFEKFYKKNLGKIKSWEVKTWENVSFTAKISSLINSHKTLQQKPWDISLKIFTRQSSKNHPKITNNYQDFQPSSFLIKWSKFYST